MMDIRRVLFPTDLSPVSSGVLPYAAHIANTHGAEVHLLHVNILDEDDPYVLGQSVADSERHRTVTDQWASEQLDRLAAEPALEGVRVFRELRWDTCASTRIAEYVGDQGINLVVMGTHGSPGVRNWLVGSVASEVIRTAPCSVLIVPFRGEPPRKPSFRRILAPVDFSASSKEGLSVACELTLGYGAHLELLHVHGHQGHSARHSEVPGMENGSGIASVPRGEGALASFFREVGGRLGIPAMFNVCDGNPGREIARFAEGRECDLIVLASLGLTGIDRFLLGSTAERVIAGAHCPVLVVRPQGRSLLVTAPG